MATVVGDISVLVGADITALQRAMRQGTGSVGRFESAFGQSAARVARAAAGIGAAAAAAAGAVAVMAANAANAGAQISRLAQVSNTSTTEFQRLAAASATVGIEQDKLADILKDVNDRVGDFIATGGGPMADFFENIAPQVGVTADQFARLGGPEALQLYVTSLEKAGVTQAEMTFYLEAMASDLTVMLPLLRNNGFEMNRLGDAAESAGRILSEDAIDGAVELNREMNTLTATISDKLTKAILDNKDELILFVDFITEEVIPAIARIIQIISEGVKAINAFNELRKGLAPPGFTGAQGYGGNIPENAPGSSGDPVNDAFRGVSSGSLETAAGEFGTINPDGSMNLGEIVLTPSPPEKPSPPETPSPPGTPETTETGSGGGGGTGPTRDDFDALRERYLNEYELMQEEERRQFELLEEYRQLGLTSEREYKDALLAIEESYGRDKKAMMMRDLSGLSDLMQAENENLFKIGKAAALANAVVNGQEAASAAWEKGMAAGGPPLAAAFAAASLARTGVMVSNIANTSIGGGGGGASSGGGAAAAPAAADTLNVNLSVAGQAGAMTDPAAVDGFASMLLDNFRDRGVVVNVR